MQRLSSGLGWLVGGGLFLLLVAGLTTYYQYQVVTSEVESSLGGQLKNECEYVALVLEARATFPSQRLPSDRRLTIIDREGVVQFETEADPLLMDNHNSRQEVALARRDGFALAQRLSATTKRTYLYAAKLVPDGRVVRISAPLVVQESLVGRRTFPVLFSTGIVVLGGGMILLAYTWRSRVRVADLVEVSRAFGAGDLARRAQLTGTDAFARLGHELNNLGSRLRESQERVIAQRLLLDGALGALAEGVACIDPLDRVVYANAAYRLFAAGGGEVLGQVYYRHISADVVGLAITALKEQRDVDLGGLRFEHRRRQLQAAIALGGEGVTVLVLRDRTELTRAESARRDFLSAVSHELKTPLTAIIGFSDTLLDGALEEAEVARSMVDGINRHGCRLLELVCDVLTLSRLEHGAWMVRPETIDWAQVLRTVLDDQRAAASAKPVTLRFVGPDQLLGRADPELIRQLVGNLVSNSIRYNRPQGSVEVRLARQGERVSIAVQDTGIGIPIEHQERVFERFYRVDSHRSRAVGGTGLGLAIVKHLCEVLGGAVALVSTPEGTTFTIDVPLAASDDASALRLRTLGRT